METTIATAADVEQLAAIQRGLARNDLLPAEHLVDGGYMRGRNLLRSREDYGIDLIGPVPEDHSWQAKAGQGFAMADFAVDGEAQVVTCPQGRPSARWPESRTARDRTMIHVKFAAEDCAACPVRPLCTRGAGTAAVPDAPGPRRA